MNPETISEAQHERDARLAVDLANIILGRLPPIPPAVAYNLVGNLTRAVFVQTEYVIPLDALEEYDRWAAYTREMIEHDIKEKMQ